MRIEYECSHCEEFVGSVIRDHYGHVKKVTGRLCKAQPGQYSILACGNGVFRKIMSDFVCGGCGQDLCGREIN
jgi:hypothetical protein